MAIIGILLVLVVIKLAWFDRYESPLVSHLRSGELASLTKPAWRNFAGELRLVGYRLDPPRTLTLYWEALQTLSRGYTIQLTVKNSQGVVVSEIRQPNPGMNWTSYWEANLLVRDEYVLPPVVNGSSLTLTVVDSANGHTVEASRFSRWPCPSHLIASAMICLVVKHPRDDVPTGLLKVPILTKSLSG